MDGTPEGLDRFAANIALAVSAIADHDPQPFCLCPDCDHRIALVLPIDAPPTFLPGTVHLHGVAFPTWRSRSSFVTAGTLAVFLEHRRRSSFSGEWSPWHHHGIRAEVDLPARVDVPDELVAEIEDALRGVDQ